MPVLTEHQISSLIKKTKDALLDDPNLLVELTQRATKVKGNKSNKDKNA